MTPELSREIGRIMGKASPAPTLDERQMIVDALQLANDWEDLPANVVAILDRLQAPTKLLPNKKESRAARLSNVNRVIIKDSDKCPLCVANDDPRKVPVHPNCHCDVVTNEVETGVVDSSSRLLDVIRSADGIIDIDVIGSDAELPDAIQINPETVAVFDPENVRFADLARWLEQMQPYLQATNQYISIVVDEDTDEAIAQIEETLSHIAENPEEIVEAIRNKKLWFGIAQAVI